MNADHDHKIVRPTISLVPPALPEELSPSAQAIATARYHELVLSLGKEIAYESGWRGAVAKKLGISGSLLSQILTGRKVTRGTIEKAIVSLKLPHDHFGTTEEIRTVPQTSILPPPSDNARAISAASASGAAVDPLLVIEAYRALPVDVRRRVLAIMKMIDAEAGGMISS